MSQGPVLVKVRKLYPDVVLPTRATEGSACWDVYALEAAWIYNDEVILVRTGLAFEVPDGWVLEIRPRSGLASKGVIIPNSPGTLDSDYRGELLVPMFCDGGLERKCLNKGTRIAQVMLKEVIPTEFVEVSELTPTERGTGGFGSTGR